MPDNNLKFYTITDQYIDFLRKIEPKVQKNYPKPQIRPYIGIVLTMGIHQYFAPLSSYKPATHDRVNNNTLQKVYGSNSGEKLAVIKLNNMFPIIASEVELMDFSQIQDEQYRGLLQKEYRYIIQHQEDIRKKAQKLYNDVVKGHKFYSRICCNYSLMEKEYTKFVR